MLAMSMADPKDCESLKYFREVSVDGLNAFGMVLPQSPFTFREEKTLVLGAMST